MLREDSIQSMSETRRKTLRSSFLIRSHSGIGPLALDVLQELVERGFEVLGGAPVDLAARPLDCGVQPLARKGLHEVVDRVGLERLQGVAVEGGDEDDRGEVLGLDARQDAEAVEARHLHVEEHEVRLPLADRLHGLEAVAALTDDLDVGFVLEPVAHPLARQRFIVDDQGPDFHPHLPRFSATSQTVIRKETKGVIELCRFISTQESGRSVQKPERRAVPAAEPRKSRFQRPKSLHDPFDPSPVPRIGTGNLDFRMSGSMIWTRK